MVDCLLINCVVFSFSTWLHRVYSCHMIMQSYNNDVAMMWQITSCMSIPILLENIGLRNQTSLMARHEQIVSGTGPKNCSSGPTVIKSYLIFYAKTNRLGKLVQRRKTTCRGPPSFTLGLGWLGWPLGP